MESVNAWTISLARDFWCKVKDWLRTAPPRTSPTNKVELQSMSV